MSNSFGTGNSGNDNVSNVSNVTTNFTADNTRNESKILEWLSPLEPWVRHRDIGAQRVDSIGAWLLETKEFRGWYDGSNGDESDHKILFCLGNPGVGKSHITSLVIDKLCDEAEEDCTAVMCFYFDFAARHEQSPVNMLGSLLRQLVSGPEGIAPAVVRGYRNQRKGIGGRALQVLGILKMFRAIIATQRTFICVDALDECMPEHRMVVLESLGQILQGSPNTRIFMTGRPHVRSEVERKLEGAATFLSIQPTEDSVLGYLRAKLRNDTTPEIMSSTLEAEIMKSIPKINSETFLLASIHIKAILRGTTIADRRRALESIKDGAGSGDAYGVTLERIQAQGEEMTKLAMAALTWVCYSERPLQVDELCHALAVEIGATYFDPEKVPSIGTLLHCCQGLIAVNKETSTAQLIHPTVQEYLFSHPGLFRKPDSILAETCLTYLSSQQVKGLTSHPLPDHQSTPFLKYSSRYWGTHAGRELSGRARTLALVLLGQYEDHVSSVSLLQQVTHPSRIGDIDNSLFSGLHAASFFGTMELMTAIINAGGYKIDQRDCTGSTPLVWVAKNGHVGAAKLLLGREDVDPNRPDKHDRTPLWWAAAYGHEGVTKLLLGRGDVDPDRPDKYDRTPLGCAAVNGHEGVVELLLEQEGVDPDRLDGCGETPIGWAAINGHEGVVRLLLGRGGVDPNRSDVNDRTPLGCAAVEGHEGVIKLLLEREDVDPNRPDKSGQTPLRCATFMAHEVVVKLLLGREDVDPNRPDQSGQTPLGCAAVEGHKGVVKLLLGREDIDPNRPDKSGQTPLGCAVAKGHEGVVKLLLEQESVDPHRPDNHGGTPLFYPATDLPRLTENTSYCIPEYEHPVTIQTSREENDHEAWSTAATVGRGGTSPRYFATKNTSYSIPEDGRPVTIQTSRRKKKHREATSTVSAAGDKTAPPLLMEYFEGGKASTSSRRPSVRVKPALSTKRSHRHNTKESSAVSTAGDGTALFPLIEYFGSDGASAVSRLVRVNPRPSAKRSHPHNTKESSPVSTPGNGTAPSPLIEYFESDGASAASRRPSVRVKPRPSAKRSDPHNTKESSPVSTPGNETATSLLIEYFEGGKASTSSRPSVRVKPALSAKRSHRHNTEESSAVSTTRDGTVPSSLIGYFESDGASASSLRPSVRVKPLSAKRSHRHNTKESSAVSTAGDGTTPSPLIEYLESDGASPSSRHPGVRVKPRPSEPPPQH